MKYEVSKQARIHSLQIQGTGKVSFPDIQNASGFITKWTGILVREFACIEDTLTQCVNAILNPVEESRRLFIGRWILGASCLTFEVKRTTVIAWNKEFGHLEGKKKAEIEKNLGRIIRWRNLIVHGTPIMQSGDKSIMIKYFRGRPEEQTFDEQFINNASKINLETNKALNEINTEIREGTWAEK